MLVENIKTSSLEIITHAQNYRYSKQLVKKINGEKSQSMGKSSPREYTRQCVYVVGVASAASQGHDTTLKYSTLYDASNAQRLQ